MEPEQSGGIKFVQNSLSKVLNDLFAYKIGHNNYIVLNIIALNFKTAGAI